MRSLCEYVQVRKTAVVAIGNVAERGCLRAITAILLRLDDTCVAAPQRLDQGTAGVLDVKLSAVMVLERLAEANDAHVLGALYTFQNSLRLPLDDKLHRAVMHACENLSAVIAHDVEIDGERGCGAGGEGGEYEDESCSVASDESVRSVSSCDSSDDALFHNAHALDYAHYPATVVAGGGGRGGGEGRGILRGGGGFVVVGESSHEEGRAGDPEDYTGMSGGGRGAGARIV